MHAGRAWEWRDESEGKCFAAEGIDFINDKGGTFRPCEKCVPLKQEASKLKRA
jgi:hypothetical protein